MNTRHCYKCGHDNEAPTGDSLEACPQCGAIYTRVEAYMRAQKKSSHKAPQPVVSTVQTDYKDEEYDYEYTKPTNNDSFIEYLRVNSLYPNFRGVVSFFYWITVGSAGLIFLSGIIAASKSRGWAGTSAFFISFFIALFMTVIAKAGKELSFMLADMADASVFTAASHRKDND